MTFADRQVRACALSKLRLRHGTAYAIALALLAAPAAGFFYGLLNGNEALMWRSWISVGFFWPTGFLVGALGDMLWRVQQRPTPGPQCYTTYETRCPQSR